jgi:hypothetical protein
MRENLLLQPGFEARTVQLVASRYTGNAVRNMIVKFKHIISIQVLMVAQCVPRSKHSIWVIKTNLLGFYKAEVAVCSEIRNNT